MKEAEFINQFNVAAQRIMSVYPNAHKYCVGPCKCKKEPLAIKNYNIIDQRENSFCGKHNITFNSECHQLPSGKIKWIECPKCYQIERNVSANEDLKKFNQELGMRFNNETKEWYRPIQLVKPAQNDEYTDYRTKQTGNK